MQFSPLIATAAAIAIFAAVLIGPASSERKEQLFLCEVSATIAEMTQAAYVQHTASATVGEQEKGQAVLDEIADRLEAVHPPRLHFKPRSPYPNNWTQVEDAMRAREWIARAIRAGRAWDLVLGWDRVDRGWLRCNPYCWSPQGHLPDPVSCGGMLFVRPLIERQASAPIIVID